jgi:trigger factor
MVGKEKLCTDVHVTRLPNAEVEIRASVSAARLAPFRERAVKHLLEEAELPGFRKGKVPEKMFVERVGEMRILEEAAERAIAAAYMEIIEGEELSPLGRPEVTVRSLAPGNPLEFSIKSALTPTATLPDYRALAATVMGEEDGPTDVTDAELSTFVNQLMKRKSDDTSEVTLDEVKKFGAFESVEDFKTKIRTHLVGEKERAGRERKRMRTIESITTASVMEIPNVLIESELDRMLGQFEADITRLSGTFDEYLKKTNKTIEGLRTEWRSDAEKRAKVQIALNEIATKENIVPPRDVVDAEVKHMLDTHAGIDKHRARGYIETVVTNEEVFRFLENTTLEKVEKK